MILSCSLLLLAYVADEEEERAEFFRIVSRMMRVLVANPYRIYVRWPAQQQRSGATVPYRTGTRMSTARLLAGAVHQPATGCEAEVPYSYVRWPAAAAVIPVRRLNQHFIKLI